MEEVDSSLYNADWSKQSWDLPAYKSAAFLSIFPDLEAFRKLPVYQHACDAGLIHDDEWVADWVEVKVAKSFVAPPSGTTGLGGYTVEGKPTKKKKTARRTMTGLVGNQMKPVADLARLVKKPPKKRVIAAHTWKYVEKKDAKLITALKSTLKAAGKRLATKITSKLKLDTKKVDLGMLLGKADPTQAQIDEILDAINIEGFAISVMDEVSEGLEQAFKEAALEALKLAGIENSEAIVDHVDERAVDYAHERGAEMVGKKWVDGELVDNPASEWSIGETTRDNLRDLVEGAVEDGDSTQELMESIMAMGDFGEARAEMIARTELAFAHVAGNLEGWRTSGVVEKKQWIVGAGCCDECAELDKEIVDLDEEFSSGDDGPPAHPNCRCDVVAFVEGEIDSGEPIDTEEEGDGA